VIGTATARITKLQPTLEAINESIGTTRTQVQANGVVVGAGELVLEAARSALAALVEVPGLVDSGLGPDLPDLQTSDIGQAETRIAAAICRLEPPRRDADANAVLAAASQLQNGPAATLEPRVAEIHSVLTAAGRDETGEVPLVDLAERLRASVAADRELLTERERRLFEDYVLARGIGQRLSHAEPLPRLRRPSRPGACMARSDRGRQDLAALGAGARPRYTGTRSASETGCRRCDLDTARLVARGRQR